MEEEVETTESAESRTESEKREGMAGFGTEELEEFPGDGREEEQSEADVKEENPGGDATHRVVGRAEQEEATQGEYHRSQVQRLP